MDHLEGISEDELRATLDRVSGKRPVQRLLAAIAYKNGVSQSELAKWHGVERKTIYNWLTRLDGENLEYAVHDEPKQGRPRKLSRWQRAELTETLHEPPGDAGFDARTWTPELVREHVRETFDVEYSIPSCRRLLKDAGLTYVHRRRTVEASNGGGSLSRSGAANGGIWIPP